MENAPNVGQDFSSVASGTTPEPLQPSEKKGLPGVLLKKIRGGLFLVLGFMLSPLSWWNDLFFNLPIAYGFGYLCSFFSQDLLLPCSIVGYWISNILGILLMQVGAVDVFQDRPKNSNLKKELLSAIASSAAYSLAIFALIHFKIIDTAAVLSSLNLNLPF